MLWVSPQGSRLLSCLCFCFLFPEVSPFSEALYSPECLYSTYSGLLQDLLLVEEITCPPPQTRQTETSVFISLSLSAVHLNRFLLVLLGIVLNLWIVSSCGFWAFFGAFIFLWVCTELLEISLKIMGCVFSNDFNGVFGEERSRRMCLGLGSSVFFWQWVELFFMV